MRNVKNGWFIRYIHSSGASCLFIMIYCHMLRAIYYRTFRNTLTWLTGLGLFFLMMATGFLGYVIVWGQMSLWGATVITNLFGAIPIIGDNILILLWGGFSVDNGWKACDSFYDDSFWIYVDIQSMAYNFSVLVLSFNNLLLWSTFLGITYFLWIKVFKLLGSLSVFLSSKGIFVAVWLTLYRHNQSITDS